MLKVKCGIWNVGDLGDVVGFVDEPQGGEWVVRMKTYRMYCCIIGCKDTHIYHMVLVCENKCGTPMLTWKILGSCTSKFKTGLRI